MKNTRKKIVIWWLFLFASGFMLNSLAYADNNKGNRDDNRGNMGNNGNGYGRGNSEHSNNAGGKSAKRFLRQADEDNLDSRINGIPSFKRVESLLRVLMRIDALETSIQNNASLTAERKARYIGLLEEVRVFIQDRLDAIIGSGTGATDTTAPTINSLSLSGTTSSGTTLLANVSEDGKWFFVVLPSGSATPSAIQIKAGQDALGVAASIKGSGATLSGSNIFPVAGLSPNTTSILFFTAEDTSSNLQPIPRVLSVTTLP